MKNVILLIAALGTVELFAETPGRAVLGYVVDAVRIELRPVEGTTGAARIGAPLNLPEGVRRIELAAGHEWALLDRGAGLAPLDLDLETGVVRDLPIAEGGFARVVTSASGRRVALVRAGRYELWERRADGFHALGSGAIEDHEAASLAVSDAEPELAVANAANGRQAVAFDREGRLYMVTAGGELRNAEGTVLASDPELGKSIGLWAGEAGLLVAVSAQRLWRVDLADGTVTVEELRDARLLERWRVNGLLHLGGKVGEAVELYSSLANESRRRWVPALVREGGAQ